VLVVVFEGVQTLDLSGPAEVFAAASRALAASKARASRAILSMTTPRSSMTRTTSRTAPADGAKASRPDRATASLDTKASHASSSKSSPTWPDGSKPHYEVVVVSTGGGERTTSCGLAIHTRDLSRVTPRRDDLVIVAGGDDPWIRDAVTDRALLSWLQRAARVVRRVASVCSGSFVLAAAGLLDGKRATTHWSALDQLAALFPRVEVDRNAIFVIDGSTWTSAGVTTGIDMSLAIVEEDLGAAIADDVAARLVLYVRRPGFQSQWSEALVAQQQSKDPLAPAIAWARANLAKADLDSIAKRAGLSPRTFHRRCLAHLSTTPAKLLDKLRVERARELLAAGEQPIKVLAVTCGWVTATRMTRAFVRELGMSPRAYRLLHT
jgi:transcriptional regulator GlxA family with amidase domain